MLLCKLISNNYLYQAQNTPYYILKKYQYYKLLKPIPTGYGCGYDEKTTTTVGFSETKSKKVTKSLEVTYGYTNEMGVTEGPISASNTHNFSSTFGYTEVEETTMTTKYSTQKEITITKTILGAHIMFIFQLCERYELYRMNSNSYILSWDIVKDQGVEITSFPHSEFTIDKKKSSSQKGMLSVTYIQHEPENLIPRMYSNSWPGDVSVSSKYSSSYDGWKAFDGEDESSVWSRWISRPSGAFNEEWIEYKFDKSVTVKGYNITPKTGRCINRTPYKWKLVALYGNGAFSTIIDNRSGYSINDWQNSSSKNFTVAEHVGTNKYRLIIEATNGSIVTSIRKFKIFGKSGSSSNKSGLINFDKPEVKLSKEVIHMLISPNPSNGNIKISFKGLNNYEVLPLTIDTIPSNDNNYQEQIINGIPIKVFDIRGQLVYSTISYEPEKEISLNLERGIYFIKSKIGDNEVVQKLLIE